MRTIGMTILNLRLTTRGGNSRIHLNLMARCWLKRNSWDFPPTLIARLPVQFCRRFGPAPTGQCFQFMAVRASGLLATHISAELPTGFATALHIRRRVPSRRQLANHNGCWSRIWSSSLRQARPPPGRKHGVIRLQMPPFQACPRIKKWRSSGGWQRGLRGRFGFVEPGGDHV